jgi:hypothetical protein
MTNQKTPTPEQLKALHDYAKWAGRTWKDQLNRDWMRAGSDWPGEYGYLQQVRNTFGPSWLLKFKLDK